MRRTTVTLFLAAATATTIAAAPSSSGELCYDLDVNVQGDQLVDESDCVEAPAFR